jgi:hypothetical protein
VTRNKESDRVYLLEIKYTKERIPSFLKSMYIYEVRDCVAQSKRKFALLNYGIARRIAREGVREEDALKQ